MMDRRVKERLIGASILVALVVLVVPELLSGPKPSVAPALALPASAPDPIRNVTVDLTTNKPPANDDAEPAASQAAASGASSADHSPAAPPPSAPSTAATGLAATNTAATNPAATSPAPIRPTPTSLAPAGTASAGRAPADVSSPANAPARASKAAAARPTPVESAASSPTSVGRGSWSVQLGSFASRANADNLTRQVKGQGFAVFILAGGSGTSARYRVRVGPLADRGSAERTAAKLKSLGHPGSLVAPSA